MGDDEGFYTALGGGRYRSNEITIGPWDPGLQHGGPPAALALTALAEFEARPGIEPASYSIDFHGPVPYAELHVECSMVRPGKRIELVAATIRSGGRIAIEVRAWRMSVEEGWGEAAGGFGRHEVPAMPTTSNPDLFTDVPYFPYGHAIEWRPLGAGFVEPGPCTMWARPRYPVVSGAETPGVAALALMADAANGFSFVLPPRDWSYVPIQVSASLRRQPVGEWICMDAASTITSTGTGTTDTRLGDASGWFGTAVHTLFVQRA